MAIVKQGNESFIVTKPLIFPQYQGKEYAIAVQNLMDEMIRDCAIELLAQVQGTADSPFLERIQRILNTLLKKWEYKFLEKLPFMASRMLLGIDKASSIAINSSLKEISKDISISPSFLMEGENRPLFEAEIQKNVNLFKTIPAEFFGEVQETVIKSIVQGRGLADLVPYFQGFANNEFHPRTFEKNYAYNRALDQSRKAYQSINTMRAQKSGSDYFRWQHSGGSPDPRQDHIELHNKIFKYDEPPVIYTSKGKKVRGYPAEAVNCRCTMSICFKVGDRFV